MKKLRTAFATAIAAAALLLLIAPGASSEAAPNNDVLVDVIIGFDSAPGASEEALVRGLGGQITHRYTIVPGMAASIPEAAIAALRNNPNVAAVDLDGEVHAFDGELTNAWGVNHIDSGPVHTDDNFGTGVKLAVIDTGIGDGTGSPHVDLAVAGGRDFVEDDDIPQDGYGHGTHVAGTACALDNGITDVGVVGVAPGCALYNLRVLNNSGSGSWSDILAAINWSVVNGVQVANLSLGGSQYPGSIVENGFNNAAGGGLIIVAAAGNSGNRKGNSDSVGYPARFDGVIAVAATNSSDVRASFSSTGPDVEISAPGVSINSTVPSGSCSMCTASGYRTASGTSMASPHVAGVAALMIAAGVTDVRAQLSATAIPLGTAWKYGAGLVDAPGAVGLGDTPPPPPTVGTLSGTVAADGGTWIEGATVSLDTGESTLTSDTGTYSFADVLTGTRSVSASASGFVGQSQDVAVTDGDVAVADFVLATEVVDPPVDPPPPAELNASVVQSSHGGKDGKRHLDVVVTVLDAGNNPVAGVAVTIELFLGSSLYGSATGTTGSDGVAKFIARAAATGCYTTDVTSLNGAPNEVWPGEEVVYCTTP